MTSTRLDGDWWSPTEPGRRYSGYVKVRSSGRSSLHWSSAFDDQAVYKMDVPALHGKLSDGREVTLWSLGWSPIEPRQGGTDTQQRWHRAISVVAVGAHLGAMDEVRVTESRLQFQHLGMWSRHPDPVAEGAPEPQHEAATFAPYGSQHEVTVEVAQPQVVRRRASNGSLFIPQGSGDTAAIVINTAPAAPFAFHERLTMDARNCLTFAYQRPAHLVRQEASIDGRRVRIYRHRSVQRDAHKHSGFQMLFTANDSNPSVVLAGWWRATTDLYPLPQILSGGYYAKLPFIESQVASAVAALESTYEHLDHLPRHRMDATVFAERQRWHLEHEDDDDFKRLLDGLSNRPTLRQKLKAVGRDLSKPLLEQAAVDLRAWEQDVMHVRDRIAHTGSHVTAVGTGEQDVLARVDRDTRAVLSLVLCRAIGLNTEQLMRAGSVVSQTGPKVRGDSSPIDFG